MKIIFLGAFTPNNLLNKYTSSIDSYYRASESMINGLRGQNNVDIKVITSPDFPSYPKSKIFYLKGSYDAESNSHIVSSLNITLIKQVWTVISMFKTVSRILRNQDKTVIIVPYMVFRHVLTAFLLKKKFKKRIHICQIVPDVFFPDNWFLKRVNKITEKMAIQNDSFVLYTKKMADYLDIEAKPHIVIEGFVDIEHREIYYPKEKFVVTYTGSLNINYGIIRLLQALKYLHDESIEFHIYGTGDAVELIKEIATKEKRIKFFGRVQKDLAIKSLYNSSVLINPRNSTDGEYVDYSFPSKDIEYLGTGVPTVLCKLPGMPTEYYGFFIDAGNGTAEEIANAINLVKNMTIEERVLFGEKAQSFIMERMNPGNHATKIIELIKSTDFKN